MGTGLKRNWSDSMRDLIRLSYIVFLSVFTQFVFANDDFFESLPRVEVASDVLVIEGRQELFHSENYGAIANSILIDSDRGVLLVDTGSNALFGEWLKNLALEHFGKSIVGVINTHGHPDHWFGNGAFGDVPKLATREMIEYSKGAAADLLNTLYSAVGDAMVGTQLSIPDLTLGTSLSWGRYEFEVITINGHSHGDAAFFDPGTGLLIAGDLVFNGRSPTTPHADISVWIQMLSALESRAPRVVIPGHGPVDNTLDSIRETREYLNWLDAYFHSSARDAVDPARLIYEGVPERWQHLKVVDKEFSRSVVHLYSDYEAEYAQKIQR